MNILDHLLCDKERETPKTIVIRGFFGVGIAVLSIIPVAIIVVWLSQLMGIDYKSVLESYDVVGRMMENRNPVFVLFYAAFLGPLYEEILFRLGLSFKKWHMAVSGSVFIFFVLNRLVGLPWLTCAGCAVSVLLLTALFVPKRSDRLISEKYKKIVAVVSILAFGLLHLINYSHYDLSATPVYLFMLVPVTGMGVIFTYYRLNLGFVYGLLLHCLVNGLNLAVNFL